MEYAKDLRSARANGYDQHGSNVPISTETVPDIDNDSRSTVMGLTAAKMYDCGGILRNLDKVLGARRYLWMLPVSAPGLGCVISPVEQSKLARS